MKVRFWGVRGSIPVPGEETSRYGGNSSCVEIQMPGGPPLVLDCGTGARPLGRDLVLRQVRDVHVLFTHFHMDHLFGFPFFGPIYTPNTQVHVSVPAYSARDAESKLGRYLSGIYHPVRLRDVAAQLSFRGVRPGRPFEIGPYAVQGVALNHPGGATGYRVDAGGRSVVYLTDTAPLSRLDEGLSADRSPTNSEARVINVLEGADLLVMDTMFSYEEYLEKMTWGHSYPEYGAKLAEAAGVKHLCLFHHAPDASDAELDALGAQWAAHDGLEVSLAREGEVVDLEG